MLGTLLDRLEPLLSKAFLLSSFFPVLIFSFCNGLMLYWSSGTFQGWVKNYQELKEFPQAFLGFSILIGIAIVAFVFSTLNLPLRELLEGKHLFSWAKALLVSQQQTRLEAIEKKIDVARKARRAIRRGRNEGDWERKLREARAKGIKTNQCSYDGKDSAAAKAIEALVPHKQRGELVEPKALGEGVEKLCAELEQHSSNLIGDAKSEKLDEHHVELYGLIDYAEKKANAEFCRHFNERQFNFPPERVEPTAMGNIAESAQGYALFRYNLDLSIFWTDLQNVLRKDEKFFSTLLDAKTQLDFMVSMFLLTALFVVIWLPFLAFFAASIGAFITVALLGPLLTAVWYFLALQNYRAFAHMVRSAADLFRLELLKSLRLPMPATMLEERQIWEDLTRHVAYEGDGNLPYTQGKGE